MSLGRKLVVDPQNGKISLARTLQNYPNYQYYSSQVEQLKENFFSWNQNLSYHQKRQRQMGNLCQQIHKSKLKFERKMSLRKKGAIRTQGYSASFDTNAGNSNFVDYSSSICDHLKKNSMHSFNFVINKEISTERSWNL